MTKGKIFITCRFLPGVVGIKLKVEVEQEVGLRLALEVRGGVTVCVGLVTISGLGLQNNSKVGYWTVNNCSTLNHNESQHGVALYPGLGMEHKKILYGCLKIKTADSAHT